MADVLSKDFPFYPIFKEFLEKYTNTKTYWYIPKARTLNEETLQDLKEFLKVINDDFKGRKFDTDVQDEILDALTEQGVLDPYKDGVKKDRTALTRIYKKYVEVLGLLWVEDDHEIILTEIGEEFLNGENEAVNIIEKQIVKWQYPNPSSNLKFDPILPHLYLLQVLQQTDYMLSRVEYELFVNLASSHEDLEETILFINYWRDLNEEEQKELLEVIKKVPAASDSEDNNFTLFNMNQLLSNDAPKRYTRISQNYTYQRSFFAFPRYLKFDSKKISCVSNEVIDEVIKEKLQNPKITEFQNKADWFAYYGDPEQTFSWYTYLDISIEKARSLEEVEKIKEEAKEAPLTNEEEEEVERRQTEKLIEDFYYQALYQVEEGLEIYEESEEVDGRQYSTPIGRIDLLCKDDDDNFVVIEIKANEAEDSVFGQILRYIGWVSRNLGAEKETRGIIIASDFPAKARYSRIGLVKEDQKEFLKFKKHGLELQDT